MNYLFKSVIVICTILICTRIDSINGIINGRDAKLNEVKYEVAVLGGSVCSGGIISNRHIITAVHCIKISKNNQLKSVKIIAATNNTRKYDPEVSIVMYVKRAFLLAAYAKQKPLHDIAVLELTESLEIEKNSDKLQKLELPIQINSNSLIYPNYKNKIFKAAGFGSYKVQFFTGDDGKIKSKTSGGGRLQVAKAIVLDEAICKRVYGGTLKNRMCYAVINDPQKKTFQGFCAGDSGTPIVVDGKIVIGVHTTGGNCNNNVNPAIGIKTTIFTSFIKNAMNGIVTSDMQVYNV